MICPRLLKRYGGLSLSILLAITVFLFFSSCGAKKEKPAPVPIQSPSDSPGGIVIRYKNAMLSGEYDKAWELVSRETAENTQGFDAFRQEAASAMQDEGEKNELQATLVLEEKIEGDKARVKIQYSQAGDVQSTQTRWILLIREDQKWKISEIPAVENK